MASVTSPPSTFLGLLPLADSLVMKVGEFSTSLVSVVCWGERGMHSLVNYKMDARILYNKVIPPTPLLGSLSQSRSQEAESPPLFISSRGPPEEEGEGT